MLRILLLLLLASPAWADHSAGHAGGFGGVGTFAVADGVPRHYVGGAAVLTAGGLTDGSFLVLAPEGGADLGKGFSIAGQVPFGLALGPLQDMTRGGLGSVQLSLTHQLRHQQRGPVGAAFGVLQWLPATHRSLGLGLGNAGTGVRATITVTAGPVLIVGNGGFRFEYGRQLAIAPTMEAAAALTASRYVRLSVGAGASPRVSLRGASIPLWTAEARASVAFTPDRRTSIEVGASLPMTKRTAWTAGVALRVLVGEIKDDCSCEHTCDCDGGTCPVP